MANFENSTGFAKSRARRRIILLAACLGAVVLSLVVFLGVGRWLVVEDPLARASAIAVLSGSMPLRAIEAAQLYREGYAPQVWLTHSSEPRETLRAMSISFEGEEDYNTRVLLHEGVPAAAIHILDPPIVNTADEINVISAALAREENAKSARSVILVTSKAHTRRVRLLWRNLAPKEYHAVVRAASKDPFDPNHWWRSTSDVLDVVREILGLMNACAGLPLTRSH